MLTTSNYLHIAMIVILLCVACEKNEEKTIEKKLYIISYSVPPREKETLENILRKKEGWRLAIESDNKSSVLVEYQKEHPSYEPYFFSSDINSDGKTDFTFVITNEREFNIIWLDGDNGDFQIIETNMTNQEGIFKEEEGLSFGYFNSDNIITFKWDANKKVLVFSEKDSYHEEDYL